MSRTPAEGKGEECVVAMRLRTVERKILEEG